MSGLGRWVLVMGLTAGCIETACDRECEDLYDDCVDEGQAEGSCEQQRRRCLETCEGEEADREDR